MLVGIHGTKIGMVDMSMSVCFVLLVMVEWENVMIVVAVLLLQDVDVHRCHSSRCIDRCRNHVVECSEPNVDVSDDRYRKP